MPRLGTKELLSKEIPLLDLAAQHRIAATLDKVAEGMAFCRQMLSDLDALVKSRFIEMFRDPDANPNGFEKHTLMELAAKITDAVHKKHIRR